MAKNKVSWKIGGEAGYGIMESGTIFAKAFSRAGYNVFCYTEYPSLIRGGHNTFHVRAEDEQIHSQIRPIDILVALNQNTIKENASEVTDDGAIIFDPETVDVKPFKNIQLFSVPIKKIVRENKGEPIMRNIVALGASTAILDYDTTMFTEILEKEFAKKGEEIIEENTKLFMEGYNYVKKNYNNVRFKTKMEVLDKKKKQMLITGNSCIALGAIKAGCKFMSAYPMTPATSIMIEMVNREKSHNLIMKQTEDEISAINHAVGASFAGARAMTATSGGGFALMSETLGMIGITETPLVIVLATRGGPSTGIPTWTEQSDLKFALNASHGEFPRIILAPGDMEESFYETINAFNLAYKYHLPVIIITDKYLGGSEITVPFFDQHKIKVRERDYLTDQEAASMGSNYKRFKNTETGVSPRAVPGQKAIFMVTSDEHDETGVFDESIEVRNQQMNKRFRKLEYAKKDIPKPKLYGPKDADISIVSWGSTKGPILEAMKWLEKEGLKVNFLQITYIYPFPEQEFSSYFRNFKKSIVVENNFTGQLAGIIREFTGHKLDTFLKYDGRAFYPEEIYDKAKQLLGK